MYPIHFPTRTFRDFYSQDTPAEGYSFLSVFIAILFHTKVFTLIKPVNCIPFH